VAQSIQVDLATRSICVIGVRIAPQNLNLLCEHWHTILLKADSMNSNKKSILVAANFPKPGEYIKSN